MTTDIIDNSYKDPSYEIQKTMAIGAQTFINLLSQLEQQCYQTNYFLNKDIIMKFIKLMTFNIDTLVQEVTLSLKKIMSIKKQVNKDQVDNEKLKTQLLKQQKKNQIMRQQVLQLKELVANHVKDIENKLKDKDEIIMKLNNQLKKSQEKLQQKIYNNQKSILDQINIKNKAEISIIDEEQNTEVININQKKKLEVIIEEQQLFNTSRIESPNNISSQYYNGIKYKTQPNQILNEQTQTTNQVHSHSSRKSQNKTKSKTKFFLNDFRKMISAQTYIPSCVPASNNSSQFVSAQSSQSRLSIAQNQIQNFNTPYRTSTPKKIFTKFKKSQLMINCSKKHKIKFISSPNHSQKIKKPQMNENAQNSLSKQRSRSANNSRPASRQKLKEKDINIQATKSNSKEKISLTIKTEQIKLKNYQELSFIPNLKRTIQQQSLLLDLNVGENPIKIIHESKGIGYGISYYGKYLRYEGQFKDNFRHGLGTLYHQNIEVYTGDWERNKICGKGKLQNIHLINEIPLPQSSILSKIVYIGQFEQNRLHGNGEIIFASGDKIKTSFHDNYPQSLFQYSKKTQSLFCN